MKIKSNIYDFILNFFTGDDELRPIFKIPNPENGFIYATDTHVLIRIPIGITGNDYENNPKYPNIENLYVLDEKSKTETKTFNTKAVLTSIFDCQLKVAQGFENCKKCKGSGFKYCTCCEHENDCKKCEGSGAVEKDAPFAMLYLSGDTIRFFDRKIRPNFLYKALHVAILLEEKEIEVTRIKNQLHIKIGPCEIIIMCMLDN